MLVSQTIVAGVVGDIIETLTHRIAHDLVRAERRGSSVRWAATPQYLVEQVQSAVTANGVGRLSYRGVADIVRDIRPAVEGYIAGTHPFPRKLINKPSTEDILSEHVRRNGSLLQK
jgi:hypothetical protein